MTAAVSRSVDKRFRRAQMKPGQPRRWSLRGVWRVLRLTVLFGLAVYGAIQAVLLAQHSTALEVSRISIRGNARLSNGEVLALLDGLRGRNIVTLDLGEWRTRLLASPWVAEAHLSRQLPSRVDVELRERQPMGIARFSGVLYLVDPDGSVIDEYGPNYADLDLPIIDGLSAVNHGVDDPSNRARAELATRVIVALTPRSDLARRVSQIDVRDAHDARVILDGETTLLQLGDDAFAERLQEYLDIVPALRERMPVVDSVDLRFDERVYVRPGQARCGAVRTGCDRDRSSGGSSDPPEGQRKSMVTGSRGQEGQAFRPGVRN